jgi:hypothetical protein
MNNEPVAYRWKSNLGYIYDIYDYGNGEPLYTHPVDSVNISEQYVDKSENNRHDLTDEEIEQVWNFGEDWLNIWTDGTFSSIHYVEFARAILRKAQEK